MTFLLTCQIGPVPRGIVKKIDRTLISVNWLQQYYQLNNCNATISINWNARITRNFGALEGKSPQGFSSA